MRATTTRPAGPTAPRWPGWGTGRRGAGTPLEQLALTVMVLSLAVGAWLWSAAQIATRLTTGEWLVAVPFRTMFPVIVRLAQDPGDLPAAFGPEAATQLPGPVVFWTVAIVLLALPAAVMLWWTARRTRRDAQDEPASARWATKRDLKTLRVRRPVPGRLTLGHGPSGKLIAAEPGHSLIVLGPTQSGKTSGLAIPAIREWPGPVLATSVKTDLLAHTLEERTERGTVWTYDPTGSVTGVPRAGWSPLANCHTWSGALRTASWLTQSARSGGLHESDFWYANASKLLAPLLFAAANAPLTMTDVVRWVDTQEEMEVRLLLEAVGVEAALTAAEATWGREARTRSSVYTTAETVLAVFADPIVATSAEVCDISPEQLLDGGANTLYVCAPLHEQERLRPLFSSIVQHVLMTGYEQAAVGGKLDPPLLLVLDEAANIAPLRDLDQIASTAAGLGIQLVTIWQDRAQIVARYGERANTVVNNHRAKLILSGITDTTTTADITQIVGEAEIPRQSTTVDAEGRTSSTRSGQVQMLTNPARLREMPPFEGLLLYGRLPPVQLRLPACPESRSTRTSRDP